MQRRLAIDTKYGAPNHDDASFTEIHAAWESACKRGCASKPDGNPSEVATDTGEPILVKVEFMRVGDIMGVVTEGYLQAKIIFVDEETRRQIYSLDARVNVTLVGRTKQLVDGLLVDGDEYDMTAEAERFADGTATGADREKVDMIILYSTQSWNLAV